MDKQKAAADIIAHALPLAPFEGWNQQTLRKAALEAGYKRTDVIRVFPGGAVDAAEFVMSSYDRDMVDALKNYHLETMKIRERIATAIRIKLELMTPQREGIRKIIALMAMPFNCHKSLRHLYQTVDTIWYEAGDTSTDFNFYTKRLLLAGVYSTTLLHWLDDKSQGFESTWAFLDRRIEDVMKIEKAKQFIKNMRLRKTI
jgi:ubiquinone biosynthesis protein COQ9